MKWFKGILCQMITWWLIWHILHENFNVHTHMYEEHGIMDELITLRLNNVYVTLFNEVLYQMECLTIYNVEFIYTMNDRRLI